ncbi:hypothetical protein [Nocardia asteroides]|uniref:hypothetical protein n=1 Tax=Nocardia asteroides TaxID=1824 RepID=UPI001E2E4A56|nr:hypothetical protein [Nocardia asteroides]UGT52483.1 hypothetical protein LTT85_17230 [Nocardia asteroides]
MTAPRNSDLAIDRVIALVLLVLLVPFASTAGFLAAFFELGNHTCGADYGGCHTPWVDRGVLVAMAGAGLAVVGSTIWIAIGVAENRPVAYVPLLGALLTVLTFLLGAEIATWA